MVSITNKYYIAKANIYAIILAGYSCTSGTPEEVSDMKISSMDNQIDVKDYDRITVNANFKYAISTNYYWLDKNKKVIKSELAKPQKIECEIPADAYYFIAEFTFSEEANAIDRVEYILYKQANPHYKSLKKQYKKESNQMFFRESLDSKISLFGEDYEFINNCSINDKLIFDIYKNGKKYITTTFNKVNCKFNHFKKSVELSLEANDAYSNILNKYENTYDLIKLAPEKSWLTATKRCIIQIYIQGENIISNYAGGTYWETEVDEAIDDSDLLIKKYYFSECSTIREISLSDFNYDINTVFSCNKYNNCWNSTYIIEINGIKYKRSCSIKFTKIYNAQQLVSTSEGDNIKLLNNGTSTGVETAYVTGKVKVKYDTYRIEIYDDKDGKGTKLYQSDKLYGVNNNDFTISTGKYLYPMSSVEQSGLNKNPIPEKFNLGNFVVEYNIYSRMLCDIQSLSDGTKTYDLPYDDFATTRANYKKCIGLTSFDSENSIINIYQNTADSEEPTSYGKNEYGFYFSPPKTDILDYSIYPLAKNAWANTSLWVILKTSPYSQLNLYEKWCKKSYKQYTIKDCYDIGNVIKVLLKEIDSNIKHEPTEEYSKFLYGSNTSVATSDNLLHCRLYITQKTNILKGEYEQAAQKAEITLKNVMEMLRDCFRCYWYIDSNNRFIIEHVTYFTNGFSYNEANIGLDCTKLIDKFNKKNIQYCQHEIEYDKSDLQSRFEFNWADNSTDSMGNLNVDIKNEYIQKDNTENITPSMFSADIDYMLFLPSDFSDDGFALLAANINNVIPIDSGTIMLNNKQDKAKIVVTPQNYILSWNKLIYHYMLDMPGSYIEYNNLIENSLVVSNIRKCMKHSITLYGLKDDLDITKVVKTSFGNGYIESMTSNIDTGLITITLNYTPK